jgi:hypothetical protein
MWQFCQNRSEHPESPAMGAGLKISRNHIATVKTPLNSVRDYWCGIGLELILHNDQINPDATKLIMMKVIICLDIKTELSKGQGKSIQIRH